MTDRLTLTRAFEKAGVQRDAAEHIATEIYDAIHANGIGIQWCHTVRSEARLRSLLKRVVRGVE